MSEGENNTIWCRVLEYVLFSFPIIVGLVIGIMGMSMTRAAAPPSVGLSPFSMIAGAALALLIPFGLLLVVAVPVLLYKDASIVSEADIGWEPSPVLHAVGGFLFTGLAVMNYLYYRYSYLPISVDREQWWYAVAASALFGVLAAASFALDISGGALMLLTALSAAILPIAIYRDAGFVHGSGSEWVPNPINYYLGTFLVGAIPGLSVLVSSYYLFKRYRHVGF